MSAAPEFLTVRELAELLRIKERKVYDLASTGEVPCTRATGKLLFPEADVRAWIEGKANGSRQARPAVFLGSHDPLLEWALRQSRCGLATFFDSSDDGIDRFLNGEGIATGLHVHDPKSNEWNTTYVSESCSTANAVLISWAARWRGLVMRQDSDIKSLDDVTGHRIATRQPGSGTAVLWDRLVGQQPNCELYLSEQDAVAAVAEGMADVTFGLRSMAEPLGLHFIPLMEEQFDLLVDRRAYFERAFQDFMDFCRSDRFRQRARAMRGHDVTFLGDVRWNA
ncbi:MAG: helix-turn-helix transcriptional regulator [Pseudomonadota bacterium]